MSLFVSVIFKVFYLFTTGVSSTFKMTMVIIIYLSVIQILLIIIIIIPRMGGCDKNKKNAEQKILG